MADVVREFTIRVNTKGQIEAIKGFEKLDDSIEKTNASMGENDRKQKAVAQATSNTTKAFAKQAQGLGGVVRIYATVAANVFALSSAYNLLKRNADLEILRRSSEQLSITTGQNFSAIADSIKEVTGGAIEFRQAFQSANLALSGGLSGRQATQIAEIATKAANALGRSVPEAVQRLTQAIVKAEPELADEFGIILRVTEATNKYAKALGVLPTELSTAQKQQAIFNQFLEQGTEKFANVQIQTNPYDKLAASFKEVTNTVIELVRVPIDPFIELVSSNGLVLLGIFGAIAAKLTSLAIPALKEFTATLAENARSYSNKAALDYVKAQEAVVNANIASAESFKDYKQILGASLKSVDFSKLKGKGVDTEFLSTENVQEDVQRYFQLAFKESEKELLKFKNQISGKLKGAVSGQIIDVRGVKLSTAEARVAIEALELATKQGAQEAEIFFKREQGAVRQLGNEFDLVRTKVTAFSAQLKAATAGQFSLGLAGGFIDNLKEMPKLFNENIKAASSFGAKFAGAMGLGARGLGTLVGGVSKLLGILGPLGLAASFAITLFGEFTDALGLTSQAARDASEGMNELIEDQKLLTKQVEYNKTLSDGTFEGYIAQVKNAANLTNGFEQSLQKVVKVLENLEKANREDLFSFGTASKIEAALSQVLNNIEQQAQTIPEGMRDEFLAAARGLDVNLKSGAGIKFIGSELTLLADKLEGLDFVNVLKKNGVVQDITLKATLDEANKRQLSETIKEIFDAEQSEKLIAAINNGLLNGLDEANGKVRELENTLSNAAEALRSFNTFADKEARKFERTNPFVQQLDNLKEALDKQQKATGGATLAAEPLPLETRAFLGIDEQTSRDYDAVAVAVGSLRDDIVEAGIVTETAKSKQKEYNAELKIAQDLASKGNLGAINDVYAQRRNLVQSELNVTQKLIEEKQRTLETAEALESSQALILQGEIRALGAQQKAQKQQLELYSETNARIKIGVEAAKEFAKIEALRLNVLKEQQNLLGAIANATSVAADKQRVLDFEKQITAQKIKQLDSAIQLKRAELADAGGAKAGRIQQEIANLQKKKQLELEIADIKQITGQRDIDLGEIERESKLRQQILDTQTKGLEVQKGLADVGASNKFLSQAQNDAAKLLSLSTEIQLVDKQREVAQENIAKAASKVTTEAKALNALDSKSVGYKETSERLQAAQLELVQAENEARGLIVDKTEKLLKLEEERFQQAKDNANLFKDPQEFQALLGEQFRRAAKEFGETMGSSIDRIVGITLGTIDSGIDAFVDAVRNGEDALKAAGDAIKETFLDLNNELIKDIFKKTARDLIANITGNKNFGKSPELIAAEESNMYLRQIAANTAKTGATPTGTSTQQQAQKQQQSMFDSITTFFKDTFSKVKDIFKDIGSTISTTVSDAVSGIADFIGGIDLGGIFDSISSAFSGFGGGGAGGGGGSSYAAIAQTAISLFLAKGGITGQLQSRIPMYANGTVTNGPELAMIGEGPKREAVVPLPDNRSIPVTIFGEKEPAQVVENKINVNISGVQGNEEGIRRSANQVALEIARTQERARGRIG